MRKNMIKTLAQPINAYVLLLQEMENDGLCLSGLNEWNAASDAKKWYDSPKGKALLEKLGLLKKTKKEREQLWKEYLVWYETKRCRNLDVVKRYRHRKSTRVFPYNPWNFNAEPGDLMVDQNGKLFRLKESSGYQKRGSGELTPVEIKPPPGLFAVMWGMDEVWWAKPKSGEKG